MQISSTLQRHLIPLNDEAIAWVELGRRNLTPHRGQPVNQHTEHSGKDCHFAKTSEKRYGVSEKTVRNAGNIAAAIDRHATPERQWTGNWYQYAEAHPKRATDVTFLNRRIETIQGQIRA